MKVPYRDTIETDVWEPKEDGPSYLEYVGQRKASDVLRDINLQLSQYIAMTGYQYGWENAYPSNCEYWNISCSRELDNQNGVFPKAHWIACYAVTGGSEGYYVHVDAIAGEKEREMIFLGKFWTFEEATEFAGLLSQLLS